MKKLIIAFPGIFFLLISYTQTYQQDMLFTVKGAISVEKMGVCLIHEHVLVDFIGADSTGYHRWDRSKVLEHTLPFLMKAKEKGVTTFFECTPAYLGRDPLLLKELSEKSGVNIVTNTGYYCAMNNKYIPKHAFDDSPEDIARVWIDEFENGIEGTGIFPGFIKIAVERKDSLSPLHAKIVKAAAIAHKATGLTIVSHTGTDGPAFAQLEILKEEGVSPEAFVWTHANRGSFEGIVKAAKMGAWISLDKVDAYPENKPGEYGSIDWYAELLSKLKKENLLNKILISHDAGWYNPGKPNGGNYRGHTDIFDGLLPALKEKEFNQDDFDLLLVKNPQKAYAIKVRTVSSRQVKKMKFALMTYTFARQDWKKDGNFDLVKMCKVGQELGIEGIDIVSHSFSPLNPDSIRKVLEAHGQKVVCYTFFPPLNKPNRAEREAGIEEVKKAIEIAKRLGADKVMIHTPGNSKMTDEECRVNWIHGLQEAIVLTNAAGLTLTIESIRHSPLSTSAEMLRVIREVPGIKLVFDTGNVYACGEDPVSFYNACREHIVHAHFKDARWYDKTNTDGSVKRDFSNELIGEGDINFTECVNAMVKDGYNGYVDIEYESNKYTPDVANQKAIEYINSILKTN